MANGLEAVGQALTQREPQMQPQAQPQPQPQAQDPTAGLQAIIDTQQTTLEGLEGEVTQIAMVLQEVIGAYTELSQMTQAIMMAMQGGQEQGIPQEQMPPQAPPMPPQGV